MENEEVVRIMNWLKEQNAYDPLIGHEEALNQVLQALSNDARRKEIISLYKERLEHKKGKKNRVMVEIIMTLEECET